MEKKLLEQLYYKEQLSFRDIAKRIGKSDMYVRIQFAAHKLKSRTLKEASKIRCQKKPQSNPGRKGMPKGPKYGKDHHWFKGGYIRRDGYKLISVMGEQRLEQRYVWEQHHQKIIPYGYQVHHLNGDKLDNRIENLKLMSNADHQRLHNRDRCKETGRFLS